MDPADGIAKDAAYFGFWYRSAVLYFVFEAGKLAIGLGAIKLLYDIRALLK